MNADEINTLLATRTADLLSRWAGLPVLAKLQIGDVKGDITAYMAISGVVNNGDVNAPTHAAIVAYVKKILDRSGDGAYVTFDTDYGPGRALRESTTTGRRRCHARRPAPLRRVRLGVLGDARPDCCMFTSC